MNLSLSMEKVPSLKEYVHLKSHERHTNSRGESEQDFREDKDSHWH